MANERKYEDLRKLQKRANQRMLRLERLGIKSPAYEAVQAKLEMIGRQSSKEGIGRRFSETGRATYNVYEYQMRILKEFLNAKTSGEKGAKQWEKDIYTTSNDIYKLEEKGISKDDWLEFWKNAPSKQKDRLLGSDVVIKILRTYTTKREVRAEQVKTGRYENGRKIPAKQLEKIKRQVKDDQAMSWQDIADEIYASKNVSEARKRLGVSYVDEKEANSDLGTLRNPFDGDYVKKRF